MKTRIIYTKIWLDSFFSRLSPTEKAVFFYYFTNEAVNIIHFYECPDKRVLFDTGLTANQLQKAKVKFQEAGKIVFFNDYIYLVNARKYESYTGARNEIAKKRLISQLNKETKEFYLKIKDRGIHRGTMIPPINHKSEIISKKSEIRNKKYGSLKKLNEQDFWDICDKYGLPINFVLDKYDDLINYCLAKGKKYSNYKRALMNFVKQDAKKMGFYMRKRKLAPEVVAKEVKITPAERAMARKKIGEIRSRLVNKLKIPGRGQVASPEKQKRGQVR